MGLLELLYFMKHMLYFACRHTHPHKYTLIHSFQGKEGHMQTYGFYF